MAKPPHSTPYSPIPEYDREGHDHVDDYSTSGCNCFHFFSKNHSHEHGYLLPNHKETSTWVAKKLKKLKEVSEIVAGPKWKTFIRKIGVCIKKMRLKQKNDNKFQYDPQSYALNFDGHKQDDDHLLLPNFSSRLFASADQNPQNGKWVVRSH